MRFPRNAIKDGTAQTVTKFFWWPTRAWDTERQAHVWLWLESVKVIRYRLGGHWGSHTIWAGHEPTRDDPDYIAPEVQRELARLGIK